MGKGKDTRCRILDVAQRAVLEKGFDATSIEEIIAEVSITKSGFFYHFPDKNALARGLLERHLVEDDEILDGLFARAKDLSDDPLQQFLIGLKLLSEMLEDMPNGHPGCLVASFCCQDRLFDAQVHALNRDGVTAWRQRFLGILEGIAERYPPHVPVDLVALADMVSTTVEGGIVMSRVFRDPKVLAGQILQFRNYVRLLFEPRVLQ